MRRLLLLLLLLPFLAGAAKYVKTPCTNNGDGTTNSCAASPGAAGAWNSIDNAIAGWACGDTVNIMAGTYRTDRWTISTSCTAPSPLIIQANGWTAVGAGTEDAVYTEAVKTLTAGDWTVCTWDGSACDCDAGNQDVQIGAGGQTVCEQTWWHTKTGDGSNRVYWAVTPSGGITPRRDTLAEMTSQYDANDPEGTSTILVRWGGSLPADPSVNYSNNGNQWFLTGADYITIRGLNIRRGIRAAFYTSSGASNDTLQDNHVLYFNDSGNGSARPVEVDSSTAAYILDNEFAYSSSEPLHISCREDGTVSAEIRRNYVHNIGDATVLGNGNGGTPNCTTFTNDASSGNPTSDVCNASCVGAGNPYDCCTGAGTGTCACGVGDFNGTVVADNIFDTCNERDTSKGTYGIYLESTVKNLVARDNILTGMAACIELRPYHSTPRGTATNWISDNAFYNNLCVAPVVGTHDAAGDCMVLTADGQTTPKSEMAGNLFYNNTCVNPPGTGIRADSSAATTGNLFRNGIFYSDSSKKLVDFAATDASNILEYNLIVTGAATAATWRGTSKACAALSDLGTGNVNACPDPVFVNAGTSDYHIQTTSPAKNAGTATGMPAGRTTDINNTVADDHGLPAYNDADTASGTWDIGADEYDAGATAAHRVMVISLLLGVYPATLPADLPKPPAGGLVYSREMP